MVKLGEDDTTDQRPALTFRYAVSDDDRNLERFMDFFSTLLPFILFIFLGSLFFFGTVWVSAKWVGVWGMVVVGFK